MSRARYPVWVGLFALAAAGLSGCERGRQAPAQPPPPKVTVARPVAYPVQSYRQYNGYLEAVESVQVKARVKGFLTSVAFTEGEEVTKGDLLYEIDPREYVASLKRSEADILKAKAELTRAKADEARAKDARDRGVASPQDYQEKVASRETAEAVVKQTEAAKEAAELELSYTRIAAPIDGRISRTLVTPGNLVGQNEATLLTTIVSMDPLYVYFDVPERDLVEYQFALQERALPTPTSRRIPVEVGVAAEEGYPHAGFIDFRENRVDTGTGTVRIRGRVPNPMLPPPPVLRAEPGLSAAAGVLAGTAVGRARVLYPGLYARVRVPSGGPEPRLVIPEDALMTGQEGRYVFVVSGSGAVERRAVTVGPQVWQAGPPGEGGPPPWTLTNPNPTPPPPEGEKGKGGPAPSRALPVRSVVAIEKGLRPDDWVIVNGIQKARPGAPVDAERWEFRGPPPGE